MNIKAFLKLLNSCDIAKLYGFHLLSKKELAGLLQLSKHSSLHLALQQVAHGSNKECSFLILHKHTTSGVLAQSDFLNSSKQDPDLSLCFSFCARKIYSFLCSFLPQHFKWEQNRLMKGNSHFSNMHQIL